MVGKRDRHSTTNVVVAVDSRTVSFFSWHFRLAWRKAWFTRGTQMQKQGNTRVNYLNANGNANARAGARNGKMFIFLRLHLRLSHVNRGKANATTNKQTTRIKNARIMQTQG